MSVWYDVSVVQYLICGGWVEESVIDLAIVQAKNATYGAVKTLNKQTVMVSPYSKKKLHWNTIYLE